MVKNFLKITLVFAVFLLVLVGVSFSEKKVNISGEQANITLVTLGTQAKAYCNEANGGPTEPWNSGLCSGTANQPASRCFQSTGNKDCVQ